MGTFTYDETKAGLLDLLASEGISSTIANHITDSLKFHDYKSDALGPVVPVELVVAPDHYNPVPIVKDEHGKKQEAWRPKAVYHYIQSLLIEPHFVVDITGHWETKINSVLAYKTQFHDPKSTEPQTYISSPEFLRMVESRAIEFGHAIGVKYAEGFTVRRYPGVKSLLDLI